MSVRLRNERGRAGSNGSCGTCVRVGMHGSHRGGVRFLRICLSQPRPELRIVRAPARADDFCVWETSDPNGRAVELTLQRWSHIAEGHPELHVTPTAILSIVAEPDRHTGGRRAGEEWFYGRDIGPSAWLRVVVHYERDRGRIITAFPRRAFP